MSEKSPYKIRDSESKFPREPEIYFDIRVQELGPGYRAAIANSKIPKGSVIFKDGGILVSSIADVENEFRYAVLVDDGVWLAPRDYSKLDVTCYQNHSCRSNVARLGGIIYVAKKDIEPGEQLTIDYATLTSDYPNWTLECKCGELSNKDTVV